MKTPKHLSMTVEINPHKTVYQSAKDYISEQLDRDCFEDDTSMIACIDSDSLCVIDWHPKNPVGSVSIAASTFEEAMKYASELDLSEYYGEEFKP